MVEQTNVSHIEKRRFTRIPVPSGTTAVFNDEMHNLSTVFVMNISEAGMLICDYYPEIRYQLNTKMHDIFVNITNTEKNVSLLISQAVVVRSSLEKILDRAFYGISFIYCNPSIQERIRALA